MKDPILRRQENNKLHNEIEQKKLSSQEYSISLRKNKRNNAIKMMRKASTNYEEIPFYIGTIPDLLSSHFPELRSANTEIEKLRIFTDILNCPEVPKIFTMEILKILISQTSSLSSLPIRQYLINFGIHSKIIELISTSEDSSVISESIWCLANLMAGPENNSELILASQVIPRLLKLLELRDPRIIENLGYLLGNIIIESPEICKIVIENRYFYHIITMEILSPALANSVSYSLSSISYHNKLLNQADSAAILSLYEKFFESSPLSCLGGLYNLTQNNKKNMSLFISSKLALQIFRFLDSSPNLCNASLKIISNLSFGDAEHESFLLENSVLDIFHSILKQTNDENLALIYNTLSNLSSGCNPRNLQIFTHEIINEHEFVFRKTNEKVLVEAASFYKNLTRISNSFTKQKLIEDSLFFSILPHLDSKNPDIVIDLLSSIKSLLSSQKFIKNDISKIFKETGCKDATEKLVYTTNKDISVLARSLLVHI